jgi:predicted SAM-dependent methyltransferase|tara:strand:+ start:73 stop:696 length:624 start_codon:yes stop_codon:yes gene_type:complete
MNIHIGCEFKIGENWKNYDISYVSVFEKIPIIGKIVTFNIRRYPGEVKYGDISNSIFCEESKADNIFCSHTLEHMPLENMKNALKNIYTMLKPNGCFRIIVPSLKARVEHYIKNEDADFFLEKIGMGQKKYRKKFVEKLRGLFGNSLHLWMYDEKSMEKYLSEAGFVNIKKCKFQDSGIEVFSEVEELHRFIDGDDGFIEVAFQCTK